MKKIILSLTILVISKLSIAQLPVSGIYTLTKDFLDEKFDKIQIYKPSQSLKYYAKFTSSKTNSSMDFELSSVKNDDGVFYSFKHTTTDKGTYKVGIFSCKVMDCKSDITLIDLDYTIFYAEGKIQKN